MQKINFLIGDATKPEIKDNKPAIISHICNDIGVWGGGFVIAVSNRFPIAEDQYRAWHQGKFNSHGYLFELGNVQIVGVDKDIYVANMIGQKGVGFSSDGTPPIRYKSVRKCLNKVATAAKKLNASVHMPRIGCCRAGGKWETIERIIEKTLIKNNINVYVYDLPIRNNF